MKAAEDRIETVQEMIDSDSPLAAEYLAALLDSEELDDEDQRRLVLLEWLREQGDDYGPDDIDPCSYDNCAFEINPHTVRDGTSPEKARKLVELVRKALQIVVDELPDDVSIMVGFGFSLSRDVATWTTSDLRGAWELAGHLGSTEPSEIDAPYRDSAVTLIPTYETLSALFRELCPELLTEGMHDLLNTLYFLLPEADDYSHATDHRDTLREAFDWESDHISTSAMDEPIDRCTSRRTCDAEYMVCTDDEADDRWDAYLESCLDDGGIVEGADSPYFDREAWKRDAKVDGRGHCLSGYDGHEYSQRDFFIYRTN